MAPKTSLLGGQVICQTSIGSHLPVIQVVGIVVLSAVFLGERDIFTVRMVIGCAHLLTLHMLCICHVHGQSGGRCTLLDAQDLCRHLHIFAIIAII